MVAWRLARLKDTLGTKELGVGDAATLAVTVLGIWALVNVNESITVA